MFRSQNEMELVHFLYRLIPKSLNVLQGSSNYFSLIIREICYVSVGRYKNMQQTLSDVFSFLVTSLSQFSYSAVIK